MGRRPVRRRVHERLRHVRVRRRLARRSAHKAHQPRRHHRLQVHRHRQQRRCRRSSRSMAGASMALFRGLMAYDDAEDVRADLRADRPLAGRPGHRRAGQRVHARAAAARRRRGPASASHGSVARSANKTFVDARSSPPAPTSSTMTGTGDADLYVKRRQRADAASYDCRPYKTGSSETCKVDARAADQDRRHGPRLLERARRSSSSARSSEYFA